MQILRQATRRLPVTHLTRRAQPSLRASFHCDSPLRSSTFTNILADAAPPPVLVDSITEEAIRLHDGLMIPSACIFLDGKVFLWDVPTSLWNGWTPSQFKIFEVVRPRPEMLILGTGKSLALPPPFLRAHLNQLGIQLETMDTRNACSTYNLLSEEGRRVAAALLPMRPQPWHRAQNPTKPNQ
ncbi:NADH dehydrogenase [ubiquinone] 1 alpha subcomplex assembly factor 3 [Pleurotus pulmonarius]